tara:strand:- start:1903 stop:2955 length:1053 start_codon:yes stop_codon:yes gene_type:complete
VYNIVANINKLIPAETKGIGKNKVAWIGIILILSLVPTVASPFHLDVAVQIFIAAIGALALMVLTGIAGQISLGHAGLMATGAFTTAILYKETGAGIWITLPASALSGIIVGLIFGLPSLRLRGIYLAMSTLALHFIVIYLGGEYEFFSGASTGIFIDAPVIFGYELYDVKSWYYVLFALAAGTYWGLSNLLNSKTGRAWEALHANETAAEALGVQVGKYKLLAFVITSGIASFSGALFAYYQNFVSTDAFTLFVSIQYLAMIIIGGMGSLKGALLGAIFVTMIPYSIEWIMTVVPVFGLGISAVSSASYAAFGLFMIIFLLFEPHGLLGIFKRLGLLFSSIMGRRGHND